MKIFFLTDEQTNANEGAYLVPSNIKTLDDLTNWLQNFYPSLNDDDINDILHAYPSTSAPVNPLDPKFATPGYGPATAVNVSQIGTGQQQRAYVGAIKRFLDHDVNRSQDISIVSNSCLRIFTLRRFLSAPATGCRPLSPEMAAVHITINILYPWLRTEMTSPRILGQQRPNSGQTLPKPSAVCLSCTNMQFFLLSIRRAPIIRSL